MGSLAFGAAMPGRARGLEAYGLQAQVCGVLLDRCDGNERSTVLEKLVEYRPFWIQIYRFSSGQERRRQASSSAKTKSSSASMGAGFDESLLLIEKKVGSAGARGSDGPHESFGLRH